MEDISATNVRTSATADARLLAFLAPGLAHALGNNLFAIRGTTSVLLRDGPGTRLRETLSEALDEAESALGILRVVSEPDADFPAEQAGVLLTRLCRLCRVPLRDRALELEHRHTSLRTPRTVSPGRFVRAVGGLLRCAVEGLPNFVSGTLLLDLSEQVPTEVVVTLSVRPVQPMLPFPLELPSIVRNAEALVRAVGARVEIRATDVLLLHVPVA